MRPAVVPAHSPSPSIGLKAAIVFLTALLIGTFAAQVGSAKSIKVITLGESLSDAQRTEMLKFFGQKDDDKVYTISEKDTDEAMHGIVGNVGSGVSGAYSSTALTCRDLGDGLDVTTRNISLITPSMYAMALVTAGIGDATLIVSGPFDSTALGLTALTGVFKTWEIAPCSSGDTSKARQRLALEQLALAAEIGQAISTIPGGTDGVQPAADVILETQKTIVTDKLKKEADIDTALRKAEQSKGIAIPDTLRPQLVDLLVRLAKTDIDWSTFAAGWTIEYKANTQITMTGDGIAIRHARQTATAEAAAARTATAEAKAALTATAEAQAAALTATAAANATQAAIAAMTATAAAQPTATATPEPTATPSPFAVTGKITDLRGDQLYVKQAGAAAAAQYTVDGDAAITRGGKVARYTELAKGDTVNLVVDGNTQHVREILATAAPVSLVSKLSGLWWLLPVVGLVGSGFFVKGRAGGDPFVVKRVAAA